MTKMKFIPYLGTTSLRKVLNAVKTHDKNLEITLAKGRTKKGDETKTGEHTEIGLTEYERSVYKAELDWYGSGLWIDRTETKLDGMVPHDLSIRKLRLRFKADEKFVEALKGEWIRIGDGEKVTVNELPPDSYFYLIMKNKTPNPLENGKIGNQEVEEGVSWKEWWQQNNFCEVCGDPLQAHGFKVRTLDAAGLESRYINENVSRNQRPDFSLEFLNDDRTAISRWIRNNIVKPTGLASPNGQKQYGKDKEEQWKLRNL